MSGLIPSHDVVMVRETDAEILASRGDRLALAARL
jgi:hypothetical protein